MADTQSILTGMPAHKSAYSSTDAPESDLGRRSAEFIVALVSESGAEADRLRLAHEQALRNSMASREWDTYAAAGNIYGMGSDWRSRRYSEMKSLFTAEQVNAITTRLVQPFVAQRELLYLEPSGPETIRAAAVRAELFDIAWNSKMNPRAEILWKVMRDVVVRSRGYIEVVHLQQTKRRRVYKYTDLASEFGQLWAAMAPQFGLAPDELLREDSFEDVVVYDGPVYVPIPFDTVYKDRSAGSSRHRRFQVIERQMSLEDAIILGQRLFPVGASEEDPYDTTEAAEIPFDEAALRECHTLGGASRRSYAGRRNEHADAEEDISDEYEPLTILEFRGEDPELGPGVDYIVWICGERCIGRDEWRGSGSPLNLIEFQWDPMVGYTTSASPAMLLLREQEKLDLLASAELDGAMYAAHPTGAVNMDAVRSVAEVKGLRPGDLIEKLSNEKVFEEITVGRYTEFIPAIVMRTESAARLATSGSTSVVGAPQAGVDTATEFAGISRGAFDRISMQGEINFDTAFREMAELTWDIYRDTLEGDQQLRNLLGADPDCVGAQMQDLDGDMKVVVMGPRYHAVNMAEVQAMERIGTFFSNDPTGEAQDQIDMDKFREDYALAVSRRAVRWLRPAMQVMQMRQNRKMLEQQNADADANAKDGGGDQSSSASNGAGAGQPSMPAPVPTQPSDIVNQTVNA